MLGDWALIYWFPAPAIGSGYGDRISHVTVLLVGWQRLRGLMSVMDKRSDRHVFFSGSMIHVIRGRIDHSFRCVDWCQAGAGARGGF